MSSKLVLVELILVPIGAIIGFNYSKYPKVKEISNKINITDNGLSYKLLSF